MNVFVLNTGSSSIKASYFAGDRWLVDGIAAWSTSVALPTVGDRRAAIDALIADAHDTAAIAPDSIGHRVVHGLGESRCTWIDARVRDVIEAATELAPVHNRSALLGIEACAAAFPGVPQAADFDTAFHTTMPDEAAAYALPYAWYARRGIRRYGFHGISHRYCARRTAEVLDRDLERLRIVSAHVGNGASLAAIVAGASVDTTMGFTPLEGIMMGSRSGSIDPGLILHLLRTNAYTVAELDRILNFESGLAGVSEVSNDVREVIVAAERGLPSARLALDLYVHRMSAEIAAMAVAAGGIDALAFTGGVGEGSAYVRERVCSRLAFLGVALRADDDGGVTDREIGDPRERVRVVVVHAREEFAIARDIAHLAPAAGEITPTKTFGRGRFLAAAAGATVGAALLPSCSPRGDAYAKAVRETWRPFDGRITERRALQHEFVRYATLAPSSHNTQCWKFRLDGDRITIEPDFARRLPAVDPDDHHLFVSLGCATENLVQAARVHGWRSTVGFDSTGDGRVRIALEAARPQPSTLFDAIPNRQCTRATYDGKPLSVPDLRLLEEAGRGNGVRVMLFTARPQIERVLAYVVDGDTVQLNDPAFVNELRHWIRFSEARAVANGDGLFSRASGNPAVPSWLGNAIFPLVFTPKSEGDKYAKFIRSSAGIAVFVSDASDREHWVNVGRCYERFALQATAIGVRTAMINQPVEVRDIRPHFAATLGLGGGHPDLVVRFGRGPQMPKSLRRPVAAVIV